MPTKPYQHRDSLMWEKPPDFVSSYFPKAWLTCFTRGATNYPLSDSLTVPVHVNFRAVIVTEKFTKNRNPSRNCRLFYRFQHKEPYTLYNDDYLDVDILRHEAWNVFSRVYDAYLIDSLHTMYVDKANQLRKYHKLLNKD